MLFFGAVLLPLWGPAFLQEIDSAICISSAVAESLTGATISLEAASPELPSLELAADC